MLLGDRIRGGSLAIAVGVVELASGRGGKVWWQSVGCWYLVETEEREEPVEALVDLDPAVHLCRRRERPGTTMPPEMSTQNNTAAARSWEW